MPLKLQIKRMRYGDCAVLEGRRARLIVDCGSDNQPPTGSLTTRDFAYAAIAAQVNDLMPTHILISHLHTDHYRGFLNLGKDVPPLFRAAPPVDTAFLPWIILGDGRCWPPPLPGCIWPPRPAPWPTSWPGACWSCCPFWSKRRSTGRCFRPETWSFWKGANWRCCGPRWSPP